MAGPGLIAETCRRSAKASAALLPGLLAVVVLSFGQGAEYARAKSPFERAYDEAAREGFPTGKSPTGSGFVVSTDGLILTGAHVIDGCQRVAASNGLIGTVEVRVLAVDRRIDAAAVKADVATPMALALASRGRPEKGERVVSMGFVPGPRGAVVLRRYAGTVERYAADDETPRLEIRSPLPSGTSGGPVLDRDHRVLGMVVGRFNDRPGVALALPAATLSAFATRAATQAKRDGETRQAASEGRSPAEKNTIADFGVVRVFCR